MKNNLLSIILLITIGLSTSCKKSSEKAETTLDKNLVKNAKLYTDLTGNRPNDSGSFTIENIQRNGDVLTVSVKGGCAEDDFQVVWDGLIMLSYPAQIRLVLHKPVKSDCGMTNQFDLKINLRKILGDEDPKDFIVHVANGSVKQDKSLNPNGSVSSH